MSEILKISAIDAHVHLRDFDESHKETIETGTWAAIAGGIIAVLDMPNNSPPILTDTDLRNKLRLAGVSTYCHYGAYVAGTAENSKTAYKASQGAMGLKIYLDNTHGEMFVRELSALSEHFRRWCGPGPIVVHAEDTSLAMAVGLAATQFKPLHVAHVSQKCEIEFIRDAKEAGIPITCEVTPHHLLLNSDDGYALKELGYMKPELKPQRDVDALWQNMDVIDIIATDHAPHTLAEKYGDNPPPGVPGLETALPLMLNAVTQNRISLEQLVEKMSINPRKIFNLPAFENSYSVIDLTEQYYLDPANLRSKANWSPFNGHRLTGRVREVYIEGQKVYDDGEFFEPENRERLVMGR